MLHAWLIHLILNSMFPLTFNSSPLAHLSEMNICHLPPPEHNQQPAKFVDFLSSDCAGLNTREKLPSDHHNIL